MPDVIRPIAKPAVQVEVRAIDVHLHNHPDSTGQPGTPGKYHVAIEVIDEDQAADGTVVKRSPMRVAAAFDPMAYASVKIPGADRTLGAIMQDMLAAIDYFKGGLPPAAP